MTHKKLTQEEARRAESLVSRIQGVSSCRIRTDGTGEITEVHVVATSGKSPKLIARDVETCLKAEMDLDVDYKKIGVAVYEGTAPAPADAVEELPIVEHPARFAFVSVNMFSSRDGVRTEVELVRDGVGAFGSSHSENVSTAPWSSVAEATLRAVSEFLDESTHLCLSGVLKVPLGDDDAVVVRVDVVAPRYTKSLVGCALVAGNENQSVVFATLDAVNRVIGKLDFKSSVEYKIK